MKNINKYLNISLVALILIVPTFANADYYDDYSYGGYANTYDDYSYGGYANTYDDYSYGGYANTYDDYSYGGYANTYDDYSYGGYANTYDDYSYGGYANTYDDYSYGGYANTYDDYSYGGYANTYDDYSYGGYANTYDYGYGNDYSYVDNYAYDYSYVDVYDDYSYNDYSYYPDTYYYSDYIDYGYDYSYGGNYYGGNNYYGGGCRSNCGGGTTVVIKDKDLDVVCRVSDTRVEKGDRVTYTAEVSGGNGTIRYDWSGDVSSNSRSVSRTFNSKGDYDARVTVRDSKGKTASDDCSTVVVDDNNNNRNFDIACRVSDTRIEEGDRVRIEVDINGGNSPFDISWDGDLRDADNFDDNARSQYVRFSDSGRYDFEVTVRDDDGTRRTDDCSTIVVDNKNNGGGTYSTRVFDYPYNDGGYASVSSVFLNQVPYTGPADTFKLIGFISLVLLWSFAGAFMIRKKIKTSTASKRIAEFKEANKQTQNS